MDEHSAIVPNSKFGNKSFWASQAITWFFDSRLLQRERDPETGDYTGKYIVSAQGQPHPFALVIRIQELEKELEEIKSSGDVSQGETNHASPGWVRRVISWIVGR
ncbi:MAG TPA: hypothetical protein EYO33_23945 [Phycisphaerales bacterium]|nr:hypothetical protein [Phycisphaerales bacterium]